MASLPSRSGLKRPLRTMEAVQDADELGLKSTGTGRSSMLKRVVASSFGYKRPTDRSIGGDLNRDKDTSTHDGTTPPPSERSINYTSPRTVTRSPLTARRVLPVPPSSNSNGNGSSSSTTTTKGKSTTEGTTLPRAGRVLSRPASICEGAVSEASQVCPRFVLMPPRPSVGDEFRPRSCRQSRPYRRDHTEKGWPSPQHTDRLVDPQRAMAGKAPAPSVSRPASVSSSSALSRPTSRASRDSTPTLAHFPASSDSSFAAARTNSRGTTGSTTRQRTMSAIETGDTSFSGAPGQRKRTPSTTSRMPVPVTARRLGSVQSVRGATPTLSSSRASRAASQTPRMASSLGTSHCNAVPAANSPSLDDFVANTTLQMADLADMLSPLTAATGHGPRASDVHLMNVKLRSDRRDQGSWATTASARSSHLADSDEEEELEVIDESPSKRGDRSILTPSKPATHKTTFSNCEERVLPASLTEDGLPVIPGAKVGSEHSRLLPPPEPRSTKKASYDISDLPGATASPSRLLSGDESTMEMHAELFRLDATPSKAILDRNTQERAASHCDAEEALRADLAKAKEDSLNRQVALEAFESAREAEAAVSKAATDKLEQQLKETKDELARVQAMVFRQAQTNLRLAELEQKVARQTSHVTSVQQLTREAAQLRQTTKVQTGQQAVIKSLGAWEMLESCYETERYLVQDELQSLSCFKGLLDHVEVLITAKILPEGAS